MAYARQVIFSRPSSAPKYVIVFLNELDPSQRLRIKSEADQLRLNEILTVSVGYEGASDLTSEQLAYVSYNNSQELIWRGLSLQYGEFDLLQLLQQGSSVFATSTATVVTRAPVTRATPRFTVPTQPSPSQDVAGQFATNARPNTPLC